MGEKYPVQEDTSESAFLLCYSGNETLTVRDTFRYFGRAKELPGVKELFQRGGESLFSYFPFEATCL
jgi:hypothetical protein